MGPFAKYLEGVKAKNGIESDRQLALKVGVSYSLMHGFLHSDRIPGDEICIRIAVLNKDNPAEIIALAHACNAPDAAKQYWQKIFKAVTAAALSFLVVLSLASSAFAATSDNLTQCILCKVRRRRLFARLALAFVLLLAFLPACGSGDVKQNGSLVDITGNPIVWQGSAADASGLLTRFNKVISCLEAQGAAPISAGYPYIIIVENPFLCAGSINTGCWPGENTIYLSVYSSLFEHETVHWALRRGDELHGTPIMTTCEAHSL